MIGACADDGTDVQSQAEAPQTVGVTLAAAPAVPSPVVVEGFVATTTTVVATQRVVTDFSRIAPAGPLVGPALGEGANGAPSPPQSGQLTGSTTSRGASGAPSPPPGGQSGGSTSGGGPAQQAQLLGMLPTWSGTAPGSYVEVDGNTALTAIGALVGVIPQVRPAFDLLTGISKCANQNGIMASRLYISTNLNAPAAAAALIVSKNQLTSMTGIASTVACVAASVLGGGESSDQFDPCWDAYQFDHPGSATSLADHYYVFVAATNQQLCTSLRSAHTPWTPATYVW